MKAVLVGDHRETINWGGRAQTLALYHLLSSKFQISATIPFHVIVSHEACDGYVGGLLPNTVSHFLLRKRGRLRLIDLYLRLDALLGARDFVGEDPEESLMLLLKYTHKSSGLRKIFETLSDCDAVVINGEGSGIFSTPFRKDFFFYLAMVELGKYLKKKVFFVNGILSDCPFTGRNSKSLKAARKTLSKCDGVFVRDPQSLEFVQSEMKGVKCEYVPDALFAWFEKRRQFEENLPQNGDFIIPHPDAISHFGKLDFSRPYICLGGSSYAALYQKEAVDCYSDLCDRLKQLGLPVYLTENCGGDRFLQEVAGRTDVGIIPAQTPIYLCAAVLANAKLFVSGRFHPTILASLAGTPCVFLGAHSHKMESLQRALNYDERRVFSGLPSGQEVDDILATAKRLLDHEEILREEILLTAEKLCADALTLVDKISAAM